MNEGLILARILARIFQNATMLSAISHDYQASALCYGIGYRMLYLTYGHEAWWPLMEAPALEVPDAA